MSIQIEIITPEKVVYHGEVVSVAIPGVEGEFQILQNHAPIVSALKDGTIKMELVEKGHLEFDDLKGDINFQVDESNWIRYTIKGGVIEFNNNKAIILTD